MIETIVIVVIATVATLAVVAYILGKVEEYQRWKARRDSAIKADQLHITMNELEKLPDYKIYKVGDKFTVTQNKAIIEIVATEDYPNALHTIKYGNKSERIFMRNRELNTAVNNGDIKEYTYSQKYYDDGIPKVSLSRPKY